MFKTILIRVILAISTLTIEPMMFLWAVAGGIVKVSQDQMIMYKVGGGDNYFLHHGFKPIFRYAGSSTTLLTSATLLRIKQKQKNTTGAENISQ